MSTEDLETRVTLTAIILVAVAIAVMWIAYLQSYNKSAETNELSQIPGADVAGYSYTYPSIHSTSSEYSPAHHPVEEVMP